MHIKDPRVGVVAMAVLAVVFTGCGGGDAEDTEDTDLPGECTGITSADALLTIESGLSSAGSVMVAGATGSLTISTTGPVTASFDAPPVADSLGSHAFTASCGTAGTGAVIFTHSEPGIVDCTFTIDVTCTESSANVVGQATDPADDCTNGSKTGACSHGFMDVLSASCTEADDGALDCTFVTAAPIPATAPADVRVRLVVVDAEVISTMVLNYTQDASTSVACEPQPGAVGTGHDCGFVGSNLTMHWDPSVGCPQKAQAIIDQPGGLGDNLLFDITPSCGL